MNYQDGWGCQGMRWRITHTSSSSFF